MKILTLFVHTHAHQQLSGLLRRMSQVSDFTFLHFEGHGVEIERDDDLATHDEIMGYMPGIRTDLLLQDEHVEQVLQQISEFAFNVHGKGFYWVTAAQQGGHL